ncbi:MAG: S8 family serine peptidase [Actinomycetota bacterium]
MGIAHALIWNDSKKGRLLGAFVAMLVALSITADPASRTQVSEAAGQMVSVIVRELPGSGSAPEQTVQDLGGTVGLHIGIIDGFVADVPQGGLGTLEASPHIHSVTPNYQVQLQHAVDGFDAPNDKGSMFNTNMTIKAHEAWQKGYTGKGIDVALIDTGIVGVNGLRGSGKVINGPDLSFETSAESLRYLDTNGHGTHMAGIIAGRDDAVVSGKEKGDHDNFIGVAPDARVLNLKVANAVGTTDVSQVLAAINWVVEHRYDNGMNVRVLNLSFGTDGTQNYTVDPLAYAAEVAWRKGIVVVVAAGNRGYGSAKLNNPAYDPYVIAVGASNTNGTNEVTDDTVPDFSSCGDGTRNPDLVAPGKSIVSLQSPSSHIDLTHPEGRVGTRFFRGSGTSQSAAVVSGAAAILLQQRPNLTPDQVKSLLTSTASRMPVADPICQGYGLINMRAAIDAPTLPAAQLWPPSTGTGSLELARGSAHVGDPNGVALTGEVDIFGNTWSGNTWSGNTWSGNTWSGSNWGE